MLNSWNTTELRFHQKPVSTQKDYMGLFLVSTALLLSALPYIMFVGGVDANAAFNQIMLKEGSGLLLKLLLRGGNFLAFVGTCRFWAVCICAGMITLEMGTSGLKHMIAMTKISPFTAYRLKNFNHYRIAFGHSELACSHLGALLFFVGFIFSIVFIFISLKLHGAMDLAVYLAFPAIAITTLAVIKIILRMAEDVNEGALNVLKNLRAIQRRRTGNRAYYYRKIQSLRPPRINVGINSYNSFYIWKETKTVYYQTIIGYVINALLSVSV